MEPKQSLKEGQNTSPRGMCEGRENRGSVPIWEAPDSVRGLTRVQYPSSVNGKGYGLVEGMQGALRGHLRQNRPQQGAKIDPPVFWEVG